MLGAVAVGGAQPLVALLPQPPYEPGDPERGHPARVSPKDGLNADGYAYYIPFVAFSC